MASRPKPNARLFVSDMKFLIVFALLAMLGMGALAKDAKDVKDAKDNCWNNCTSPCARIWCLGTNGEKLANGPCDDPNVYGGVKCS